MGSSPLRWGIAGLLVSWAGVMAAWAFHAFRRHRTTILPFGSASTLITTGPFRLSRNPLYLSLASMLVALGFALDSLWILGAAPILVLALNRWIIPDEETALRLHFGEEFVRYASRVGRWL